MLSGVRGTVHIIGEISGAGEKLLRVLCLECLPCRFLSLIFCLYKKGRRTVLIILCCNILFFLYRNREKIVNNVCFCIVLFVLCVNNECFFVGQIALQADRRILFAFLI